MLSIGKMVVGAEQYYLGMVAHGREEYYTGSGESLGNWMASGGSSLGLDGEVQPDDLRLLLAGFSPQDLSALGLRRPAHAGRVAGFDLTFSAPKSVSLLYALGARSASSAVRVAHDRAVKEALSYLEAHAVFARRGAGGENRIETTGLVAAAFVHRTSRAGDPQLHTHVLAANVVLGADGRWSAPDARLLYFHARTAGFVYQAALRAGLVETLGVRFGPLMRGSAEIEGIKPALLKKFSTRRAEIEEYLYLRGESSRRTAELAALATRVPKTSSDVDGPPVDLRARWRARAFELGVDPEALFSERGRPRPVAAALASADQFATTLLSSEGLTAQESTFERRHVVMAIAGGLVDGAYLSDIEAVADRVLAAPDVVDLTAVGRGGERLHTTDELLAMEAALIDQVLATPGTSAVPVDPQFCTAVLSQHPHLSAEQKAMVRRLVTNPAGIDAVAGKAGAGKTTALALTREIFEAAGSSVIGTALSARAAEELETSAGIESRTLARFLGEIDNGTRMLGPGTVVVVDEASMVGTRTLGRLVEVTQGRGAKLILVGDMRQLPEIDAGGAFGRLVAGLDAIQLNENRRQRELWERAALDQLRSGSVEAALSAYDAHGRIHVEPTMHEARSVMVQRWLGARDVGAQTVMLAVNRRDVDALNDLARAELRSRGELGPDIVTTGTGDIERSFAVGDRVMCLRNSSRLGVLNGTRGRVVGLEGKGLAIETVTGPRTLTSDYLRRGHLGHGYATTVHKAQGATYDRAFVLATDALTREAGYVALSRAKDSSELFVIRGPIEHGLGPEDDTEPLAKVAARLNISRAKHLASEHAEGVPQLGGDPQRPPPEMFNGGRGEGESVSSAVPLAMPTALPLGAGSFSTDFAAPPPPEWVQRALGSRPAFVDEQPAYDKIADAITTYRERYGIEGDEPLGPRPFEAFARLSYNSVAEQIRSYERFRWHEFEPPTLDTGLER